MILTRPKYLTIKQQANNSADIYIYGDIVSDDDKWSDSDTSAVDFRDALKDMGNVKTINLHINSPGGDVFEGVAIYNMLKQNSAQINVYVDGLAASIASVIAMSGDTIFMPSNSMLMIHNAWTIAAGNADQLRKVADDLEKISGQTKKSYLDKAGDKLDSSTLQDLLDAETWLTAQEAVDYGLADEILEPVKAAASINSKFMDHYHNVPKQLIDSTSKPSVDKEWLQSVVTKAKERNKQIKNIEEVILNG